MINVASSVILLVQCDTLGTLDNYSPLTLNEDFLKINEGTPLHFYRELLALIKAPLKWGHPI